jgi:hypothetical protein
MKDGSRTVLEKFGKEVTRLYGITSKNIVIFLEYRISGSIPEPDTFTR